MHHVPNNGKLISGLDKAKKHRPKSYQGIIRCRPKNSEAVAMRSGAHGGLICPLEKGVRGIETSESGYLRQQIRGGRKGRAHRQGLAQRHNIAKKHRPKCYQGIIRCRAGVGGQGRPRGDGKPAGPDRPLGKGVGGIKKERAERQGLAQRPNTKKESPQTNV